MRKLGIPTVLDRFIQQAVMQVLQQRWDPTFSEHSFGFRPKRSAHQAVAQAQEYIQSGCVWVVDIDLEKFFDRVNHDRLMARIAQREKDKRLLSDPLDASGTGLVDRPAVAQSSVEAVEEVAEEAGGATPSRGRDADCYRNGSLGSRPLAAEPNPSHPPRLTVHLLPIVWPTPPGTVNPGLTNRIAVYGSVRTVVWDREGREAPPYPDPGA